MQTTSYRILLVEDDPLGVAKMRHLLGVLGHEVVDVAHTGESAVQSARAHTVDVVIMDIILEGDMNGVEAARAIREELDVPIVFLTGVDSREQVHEAIEAYSGAYLLKPPAPREVEISLDMVVYRHRLEQQVREREARLSVILRQSNQAILHYTVGQGIDFANSQAECLLGTKEAQLLGAYPGDFLHLFHLETEASVALSDIVAGKVPADQPLTLANPGQLRAAVTIAHNWVPGQEEAAAILTIDDVTDRLETEQRMRLLASSIENLSDGLLVARQDAPGQGFFVEYANSVVNEWIGQGTPVVGEDLLSVLDPAQESSFALKLAGGIAPGQTATCEMTLRAPGSDETRLVEVMLEAIELQKGQRQHVIAIARDVTRLRRLEANTRQSQKLEAVGRLADGLAHDFNNIIAIITGLSELLLQTTETDGPVNRRVRQILETSRRGADIISQLMAFSRREKEQVAHLNLQPVLEQFVPLITHLMPDEVSLELAIKSDLPVVEVSKTHIEQILLNLCTNARDAMAGRNGQIRVEVEAVQLDDAISAASQLSAVPGTYVEMRVSDSGSGIPAEIVHSIFDPFFTTKDIGKGTGLGLSTVYGILQKHRGGLRVESTPDVGTTFFLYLPIVRPTASPEVEEVRPVENLKPAADPAQPVAKPEAFPVAAGDEENMTPQLRVGIREVDATLAHALKSGLEARGWVVQRLLMPLAEAVEQGRWHQFDVLILPAAWATVDIFQGMRDGRLHNPWLHAFFLADRGVEVEVPEDLLAGVTVVRKPLALTDFFASVEATTGDGANSETVSV